MRLLIVLLTLAAFGCGSNVPNYDYSQEPNPARDEFVIGVEDQLQINVWRNPELTTSARVRPDGTITMPLLGDLTAAGKTPSQLKTEVEKRLQRWIRDESAVVTVAVTEVNSYRFTVVGEVGSPGVFTSRHYVTVLEALSMAGGLNQYAERDNIKIQRSDPQGNAREIPISWDAIARGGRQDMNLTILPGDTIVVP